MPLDSRSMRLVHRRTLLKFLLGSPLLGIGAANTAEPDGGSTGGAITRSADAIDVFDYQRAARRELLPAHYTYLSMGVQDEATLRENREAFNHYSLRPRRLVDVREVDTRSELLGIPLAVPLLLAPVGSQRAYHPEGEIAVARAAKRKDQLQILSLGSSASLAEVSEARGGPLWYQLYAQRNTLLTRHWLSEAERAGCSAIVLTVDIVGFPTGRDRIERLRRPDNPECQTCHSSTMSSLLRGAEGIATSMGVDARSWLAESMMLDWEIVDRIRDATSLPILVKGILRPDDARLCIEHGIDGIIVSNHGGRAEDNGFATIDALPEIVAAVAGRIPVIVDSGFRRGADLYKALALGASAICIGRPYIWGLAAFGQTGVEGVLELLRRELVAIMRQMGTPDIAAIGADAIRRSRCSSPGHPDH